MYCKLFRSASLFIFSLVFFPGLNAQFSISGEYRPRYEMSHGYMNLPGPDQDASNFISQRTRLNFGFADDRLKTFLSLQDVRLWGAQPQLVGNESNSISVHEAWFEYKLAPVFSVKIGRQELSYDDQRLFGNVNWTQQGRVHDLALAKYEDAFKIHAGFAYNENSDRKNNLYQGPDAYKALQFFWFSKDFERLTASFTFLNNGLPAMVNGKQVIHYSQTFGPYVSGGTDVISYEGGLFYQGGKNASGTSVSAYNIRMKAIHGLSGGVNIGFGYEMLSGTHSRHSQSRNTFNPFYGTNHKFNGYMDYFYVGNQLDWFGLHDLYFTANYKISDLSFTLMPHLFYSAQDIPGVETQYLGTEIDFTASYKVNEVINLELGYSQIFSGEGLEVIRGTPSAPASWDYSPANWVYFMITVKPKFFNSGK